MQESRGGETLTLSGIFSTIHSSTQNFSLFCYTSRDMEKIKKTSRQDHLGFLRKLGRKIFIYSSMGKRKKINIDAKARGSQQQKLSTKRHVRSRATKIWRGWHDLNCHPGWTQALQMRTGKEIALLPSPTIF